MNLKRSLLDLRRNVLIAKHAARRMALRTVQDDSTLVEKRGSVASIVLARPKALNSLTLPMVRTLWSAFKEASSDPEVGSIVMTGAGEKAFCAGGDVRAVMESACARGSLADGAEDLSDSFFREEYALNAVRASCPRPHDTTRCHALSPIWHAPPLGRRSRGAQSHRCHFGTVS